MNTIKNISLENLQEIYKKINSIKSNLKNNQRLLITLDTETTGKYYNKFQIENTSVDVVDKIIEFGAIFSIENIDNKGFKTIEPIIENNIDYGFRLFFNPFIDGHKPFHLKMPDEPFQVHGISLEFLEGKDIIVNSNEKLEEPAPSLLKDYEFNEIKSSYIKEIIYIINSCDVLVAHNATFDVGMINEAINDYNKIEGNERLPFCNCEILDTLTLFKNVFPKERLIAIQEENEPTEINHKLDNLMYLAGIKARDLHGAYWDSKLLIDSYNVLLNKYLKYDYMRLIVEKQTNYLKKLEYKDENENFVEDFKETIKDLFFEKLYSKDFLDLEKVKTHLKLQLGNINKQKRNLITENQIENSILYYLAFLGLNKNINDIDKFEEKIEKMTTKNFDKMIKDFKESKVLETEIIMDVKENEMSHYLSQAVYYYFKYQFENKIIKPLLIDTFEKINKLISLKENIEITLNEDEVYSYFRTDGSIATKDNSLTTIIGSISNVKKYFETCDSNRIICMDFNSIVNSINVGKYLKMYNESHDNKIELNYGLTTLLKINISNSLKQDFDLDIDFIDFEINIICKNEEGIRLLPNILKICYTDKFENENSYKDPYLSVEQFNELNMNDNLFITLGGYKGLFERVLFDFNIKNKELFINKLIELLNGDINVEIYPSDPFLLEYKSKFENKVDFIFTNPSIYLKDDYEAHVIRCYKYNDKIYDLNNYGIFDNFKFVKNK